MSTATSRMIDLALRLEQLETPWMGRATLTPEGVRIVLVLRDVHHMEGNVTYASIEHGQVDPLAREVNKMQEMMTRKHGVLA